MTTARHHHDHAAQDWAAMAEYLDLDAEVLHAYHAEVIAWVGELTDGLPVRQILDLGAGTGNGTLLLAQQFRTADVIAVDGSAELLARCMTKAGDLGVAARIHPAEADLNGAWPVAGPVDLAWASNSLHHLADPDRVLTDLFTAIRPDGFLVLAELESFPRFLPADVGVGSQGLEERCHAAMAEAIAHELPHLGSDWSTRVRRAGFTIQAERMFAIDLRPPLPPSAGRYAQASLRRLRAGLADRMSAEDLAAFDALLDADGPLSVLRRADLSVRARRTVLVARRP